MKTVLKFVTGSHSYNLNGPNSDYDTLSVYLLEPDEMFGLNRNKLASQKVGGGVDESTVEFSEYLRRLVAGNPSYVQTVFSWQHNLVENNTEFDTQWFRDSLELCLVADNVHRSFVGVASRTFKEYEQKHNNKSLSESFRYLKILGDLLEHEYSDVYLTGNDREYFAMLREFGSNSPGLKRGFDGLRAQMDLMLGESQFGTDEKFALEHANRLSQFVYRDFYRRVLCR